MDNKEQFNKLKISAYFFNFWSQSGFIIARLWNGFSEIWINAENKKIGYFYFYSSFFQSQRSPEGKTCAKDFLMKLFLVEIFFDIAVQEQFFEKCTDDEFLTLSQNRAEVKKFKILIEKRSKLDHCGLYCWIKLLLLC